MNRVGEGSGCSGGLGRAWDGSGWKVGMENWGGGYCGRAENFVNLHRNHLHAAFTMRKAKWTRIFVRRGGVTIPL